MNKTPFFWIFLAAAAAEPGLQGFSGTWENTNREGEIRAIRVTLQGSRLMVHAWQRCKGEICDWGTVEAVAASRPESSKKSLTAPAITATFEQPDRTVVLILSFAEIGTSALQVNVSSHFTNHLGLPDSLKLDTFKKVGEKSAAKPPAPNPMPPHPGARPPSPPSPAPPMPTASEDKIAIPQFPWPPPPASASEKLPVSFLPVENLPTLQDVERSLITSLDRCGYVEKSYYAIFQDGFALVTQLEQISRDGTSKPVPARWSVNLRPVSVRRFSLSDYLSALFTANPGHYRVIVFAVTPRAFSETGKEVSREDALKWLKEGLNKLPSSIGNLRFSKEYAVTALIYEFDEAQAGEKPTFVSHSELTGRDHLNQAKIWGALEK